jgi:hypothetical protein
MGAIIVHSFDDGQLAAASTNFERASAVLCVARVLKGSKRCAVEQFGSVFSPIRDAHGRFQRQYKACIVRLVSYSVSKRAQCVDFAHQHWRIEMVCCSNQLQR